MSDFPVVAAQWMETRGMSLRRLAAAIGRDPGYLSKVLRGHKAAGPDIARRIDDALDAGGAVVEAAGAPVAPPEVHVPQELADYFALQLPAHYTADRFLGAGRLLGVAAEQDKLLAGVAAEAPASQRPGMFALSAGFAALNGWLYQDAGQLDGSVRWHNLMIERAHRTGDEQMIPFSLHCKALLYADMGDKARLP